MDWSNPASAVVPSLDASVLAVLAGITEPISGREVHRRSRRGSSAGIAKILARLEDHGLVNVVNAPPSRLYSLNRDHVAAPAALALMDLRGQLFDRIRNHLKTWTPRPLAADIFGSAARGDGDIHSDLDILLVRPPHLTDDSTPWANNVDELEQLIARWSGNPASILQATPPEVMAMVDRNEPIVARLQSDTIALLDRSALELIP